MLKIYEWTRIHDSTGIRTHDSSICAHQAIVLDRAAIVIDVHHVNKLHLCQFLWFFNSSKLSRRLRAIKSSRALMIIVP
jgi:hypothetical protein